MPMDEIQGFLKPELIWFLAGFIMLVFEFAAPGIFFIFFAVGAWIVAGVYLFFPVSLSAQLLIFLTSSVFALILLRKRFQKVFAGASSKVDGLDPDEFIGKKAVVKEMITKDMPGKIAFHGTLWRAEADEPIDENSHVVITGRDSLTLKVKKV
ncbi:MAG TPA: NfeD family protein [Deltaproteobacteria bacterium]|nr:NfeD family protein [Deltaproteobacteria bacterium]